MNHASIAIVEINQSACTTTTTATARSASCMTNPMPLPSILHEVIAVEVQRLYRALALDPTQPTPSETVQAISYVALLNVAEHYHAHDYESQAIIKQLKDL